MSGIGLRYGVLDELLGRDQAASITTTAKPGARQVHRADLPLDVSVSIHVFMASGAHEKSGKMPCLGPKNHRKSRHSAACVRRRLCWHADRRTSREFERWLDSERGPVTCARPALCVAQRERWAYVPVENAAVYSRPLSRIVQDAL